MAFGLMCAKRPDAQEPSALAPYDVVMQPAALSTLVKAKPMLILPEVVDVAKVKADLLQAVGDERKKRWEAFLAQRESEQREKHPQVANYEKRPEPLTFQEPLLRQGQHGAHPGACGLSS